MQQDLEHLAARLGQLAQHTRQLHADRVQLRARLDAVENECQALRARSTSDAQELDTLRQRLNSSDSMAEQRLAESLANETSLRAELDSQRVRFEELAGQLASREDMVKRLNSVASSARERIEAVLAKLPGGPSEDLS